MKSQRIEVGSNWIIVETNGNGGTIRTNLYDSKEIYDEDERRWVSAVNGIESLLLAMACEGMDLTDPRLAKAIETALEAISNNS